VNILEDEEQRPGVGQGKIEGLQRIGCVGDDLAITAQTVGAGPAYRAAHSFDAGGSLAEKSFAASLIFDENMQKGNADAYLPQELLLGQVLHGVVSAGVFE